MPKRRKRRSHSRNTLAAQIRQLAKTDTFAAALLAERGKQFSEIETLLNLYYETLQLSRKIQAGEKTADEKLLEGEPGWTKERAAQYRSEIPKSLQKFAFQISQIVIDAISARDTSKIIEIVEAIEFLKTPHECADHWRYEVLTLKHFLINQGDEWEIGKWATSINWPDDDGKNGFPQLRRLLKELDAPLKPTRRIRKV